MLGERFGLTRTEALEEHGSLINMNNLTHRLSAAFTSAAFGLGGIAAMDPTHAKAWIISGALCGVAGGVTKALFPETDGGKAGQVSLNLVTGALPQIKKP